MGDGITVKGGMDDEAKEALEERAAILEFDAGMDRESAEKRATELMEMNELKITVMSETHLHGVIGQLRGMFKRHGFLRLAASVEKARTIPQNRLSHDWYNQIAAELGEQTPLQVKAICKLHYGVPIMRAEDEHFREVYDGTIKGMTYEQKLKVMEILPVTSLMTTAQLNQYLDAMKAGYAERVLLEFPDERAAA